MLIDFQPRMFMGVESHDRNAIKNNPQINAKSAKLLRRHGEDENQSIDGRDRSRVSDARGR